jgi:hypothetical protein
MPRGVVLIESPRVGPSEAILERYGRISERYKFSAFTGPV